MRIPSTPDNETKNLIKLLQEKVASGFYCLNAPEPGQIQIGQITTLLIDGEYVTCVALFATTVASILGLSEEEVGRRLSSGLIRGDNGEATRDVALG